MFYDDQIIRAQSNSGSIYFVFSLFQLEMHQFVKNIDEYFEL